MGNDKQRPILITGGGRRIGLALAHHFLNLRHPVIISYRREYPLLKGYAKPALSAFRLIFQPMKAFWPSPR
jgi:dihydromonapterin reductase/dihydrofolate reductase